MKHTSLKMRHNKTFCFVIVIANGRAFSYTVESIDTIADIGLIKIMKHVDYITYEKQEFMKQ